MKIKYIDLFAGIGGFNLGLQKSSDKFECVYSNEYDKYANSIYKKHFGECDIKDIRQVSASELPRFDLLCAGFPCQSFSIAGKRKGFTDTRGTMFFEIARIVKQRQPRLLLLENVKGLLSHDKGRTFTTIITALDELGYDIQWQVLNSKNFGVPQNRERVFIIGHLRGTPRPEVFPIGQNDKSIIGECDKKIQESEIAQTVTATYWNGGKGSQIVVPVLTPDRPNKRQNGRRFKTDGEPSFTLTAQDKHGIYDGVKIRRLTPIEYERLQGFPDNWTQLDDSGRNVSDTQRYKCLGNAVTVNVITEIGKKLINA